MVHRTGSWLQPKDRNHHLPWPKSGTKKEEFLPAEKWSKTYLLGPHDGPDYESSPQSPVGLKASRDMSTAEDESVGPNKQLHTYGDYLRDVLGPGRYSHPDEYASILDAAAQRGVDIVDRPGTLAYEPALSSGNPGRLLLDPDASIGAMRHEFKHLLDDQASGYQGFRLMADSDIFWKLEFRGYMEEINLARELREFDVGRKILKEMRARRQEIFGDKI